MNAGRKTENGANVEQLAEWLRVTGWIAPEYADLLAERVVRSRWFAEERAQAWTEGFDRGFYDPLAGHGATGRDASESAARNPYEPSSPPAASTGGDDT